VDRGARGIVAQALERRRDCRCHCRAPWRDVAISGAWQDLSASSADAWCRRRGAKKRCNKGSQRNDRCAGPASARRRARQTSHAAADEGGTTQDAARIDQHDLPLAAWPSRNREILLLRCARGRPGAGHTVLRTPHAPRLFGIDNCCGKPLRGAKRRALATVSARRIWRGRLPPRLNQFPLISTQVKLPGSTTEVGPEKNPQTRCRRDALCCNGPPGR